MKTKNKNLILISSLLTLFISPCFAAVPSSDQAKAVVQEIVDLAKTLDTTDAASKKETQNKIEDLMDFKVLTEKALGDQSSKVSAADKSTLSDLLRKIITKSVYPKAPEFFKNAKIDFTTAANPSSEEEQRVKSIITHQEKRTTVEYWVGATGADQKTRVVDLAVEGERWSENVHEQFQEWLQKKGVKALIQKMKSKVAEIDQKKKK